MDKYIGKYLNNRYKLEQVIGVGGMAFVYRATDTSANRVVAVKIIKEEQLEDESFKKRFENEAKAIAMLSHPNIVEVYEIQKGGSEHYIVMEHIDGISLKEYIEQQKSLTWKEAIYFLKQILKALQHAHNRGIIHRDIKPQNIMLLEDGTIKVTDFGIACFVNSATAAMTEKSIGSVHYISPEQAGGSKVDERTDIYATGAMLYEMLTGELPFDADSAVSVAIMQMNNDPKDPCEINPSIPLGLRDITLKAMTKSVNLRYQSASEMLSDLEEFKRDPNSRFSYNKSMDTLENKSDTLVMDKVSGKKTKKSKDDDELESDEPLGRKLSKKGKSSGKSSVVPILSGIVAAFVFMTVVALSLIVFIAPNVLGLNIQPPSEVLVPRFIGQTYDEARANPLFAADFEIVENEYAPVYDETLGIGVIVDQSPAEGRTVRSGTTVYVKLNYGKKTLNIPKIDNTNYITAEHDLRSRGIKYVKEEIYHNTVIDGYVIRTEPENETKIDEEQIVILYVSKGQEPKMVAMPKLTGDTRSTAERTLSSNKLICGEVTSIDSPEPAGTVLAQGIPEGTLIREKTAVDITVSSGRKPVREKNLKLTLPPNMTYPVEVLITQDDEQVYKETYLDPRIPEDPEDPDFIPGEEIKEILFTVQGNGSSQIRAYINGNLFAQDVVVFDR